MNEDMKDEARLPVVVVEAVAVTKENDDGELYLDWLLEGGICALEFAGQTLLVAHGEVTDDEGSGEVYKAADAQALIAELRAENGYWKRMFDQSEDARNRLDAMWRKRIAKFQAAAERGVVLPEPDEINQMAFEEGQPAENGDGYLFSQEEFDLFVQRLLDSCRLNPAPTAQPVADEREAFEVEIPDIAATFDGLYLTPMMPLKSGEHLMTVAQHLRIEKQLRATRSPAEQPGLSVPKGFVLVPKVATLQMKNAGWQEIDRQGVDPESCEMQTIYHAMLAAAPSVSDKAKGE